MTLAPLRMSVPASDGLILKGVLTYPPEATGRDYPLAVLAHQYPATRDSYAPLVAATGTRFFLASSEGDPFEGAASVATWSRGLPHAGSRVVPGSGHAMAIYFAVRDELVGVLREGLGV